MKILIVNSYYNYGSTGKIVARIAEYVKSNSNHEVLCCYAWTKASLGENNEFCYGNKIDGIATNILVHLTGSRYGFAYYTTNKLLRKIIEFNPDVINLHCTNSYDLNIWKFIKKIKCLDIPLIITEHAEFFHTGNCPYAFDCKQWVDGCRKCENINFSCKSLIFDRTRSNYQKMMLALDNYKKLELVDVSPWLLSRTRISSITKLTSSRCILNGIDCSVFKNIKSNDMDSSVLSHFDRDKKSILHVTSDFSSPRKGGHYLIELAKRLPQYNFIVIGPGDDSNSLSNLEHIKFISNQMELACYYSMADLCVLTSKNETFGMTVAESLCCGTPVVGFNAGGPESICIKEFCRFSEYGNIDVLIENIIATLNSDIDKLSISEKAKYIYSSETMGEAYLQLFEEIVGEK